MKVQSIKSQPKAITVGVSFNPGTLVTDARNYGASLSPRLGYSHVVCQALTEFLGARGCLNTKTPAALTPEEAEAIEQAKAVGIDVRAALADAIDLKVASVLSHEPVSV